jgi:hypothetical protein
LRAFEQKVGCPIPYRVAETPFFIPGQLRDRLAKHAREIVDQVLEPSVVDKMKRAIPASLDVPRIDPLPNCMQVDFAIVQRPGRHPRGPSRGAAGVPLALRADGREARS